MLISQKKSPISPDLTHAVDLDFLFFENQYWEEFRFSTIESVTLAFIFLYEIRDSGYFTAIQHRIDLYIGN